MARRSTAALLGIWVLGSVAAASGAATATDLEFYTGEALYAQCSAQPEDAARHARCEGYVLGVSDAQQARQFGGVAGRVCLPPATTVAQLVDATSRYLAAHPERRSLAAQDLVLESLAAQFPCR